MSNHHACRLSRGQVFRKSAAICRTKKIKQKIGFVKYDSLRFVTGYFFYMFEPGSCNQTNRISAGRFAGRTIRTSNQPHHHVCGSRRGRVYVFFLLWRWWVRLHEIELIMEEVLDRPFWASWLPLMLWIQLMLISCYFPILVFLSHSIFSTWLPVCSSQVSRINRKSRGFIISLWTRNPDIQMLHKKQPDYSNCPLADETHFAILMFFIVFLNRPSCDAYRVSVYVHIYIYMYICSLTFVDIYIYIHTRTPIYTYISAGCSEMIFSKM